MTSDPIDSLIAAHGLPATYRDVVEQYWQPLATAIARKATSRHPLIVGINGAQGSGKSTLCAFLEVLLAARRLRAVTLSIDDLYLGKTDRQALAREIHPLFATRGVPGTHAPAISTCRASTRRTTIAASPNGSAARWMCCCWKAGA
jgi:D-glycerate 3-kinase